MSHALQIARHGLYSSDPNPHVGCVIVKDDKVLSTGWHHQAGQAHAEIKALSSLATNHVSGAICYVSLEPCVHHGRTPPCVAALINADIKHVVIATLDPNPMVSGKGMQALNKAGITTQVGLMEQQARHLNRGFEMRMRHERPFVICKLAMSLDGKTALQNGESSWISSAQSRQDVQRLRAMSSAIMTSVATVLADDPLMNVRDLGALEYTTGGRQPVRVILDSDLITPLDAKILHEQGDVVIFHACSDPDKQKKLRGLGVELIPIMLAKGTKFLHAVLQYLAKEKEINTILLETGSRLAGQMLQANFIDELIIYVAPTLLGQDAKNLFHLPLLKDMQSKTTLAFSEIRPIGNDIRITATINKRE